ETAYDIYSGMAPIAMLLAGRAGRVIGIESNPDAVADGRENIRLNGFSNVEMVEGEAEKVIAEQCAQAPPDIVSVDPPRVGMHPKVLKAVAEARPRQVLYISCNPSTLARDAVELIEAGYSLERVIPVDMFPHTAHIEAFARFDLRPR
ncbi:MAG TPA: methyltransferase domain-containing protein, partial [bacterium]|nr:methyltransferase domain-containing protein [bacterium]